MRRRRYFVLAALGGLALVAAVRFAEAPRAQVESATLVDSRARATLGNSRSSARAASAPRGPSAAAATVRTDQPRAASLALTAALGSDDDVAKIDAVERAVRDADIDGLATLLQVDLAREPEAAPTIIHAVASLANAADAGARRASVAVLGRWLAEESQRHDPDAEGNVPNVIEALGTIGGADATAVLIGALEKGELDLSVETLLVQNLGHARDGRALEPVRRFVDRIAAIPPIDGIQEELRVEAIAAGNSAISSIQGG